MKCNIVKNFIQITSKRQFEALTHQTLSNNTYMGADPPIQPSQSNFCQRRSQAGLSLNKPIGVPAKNSSRVYPERPGPSEDLKPCLPVLSISNTIPHARQRTHTAPNHHKQHPWHFNIYKCNVKCA